MGLSITCYFTSDMGEKATCVIVSYMRNDRYLNVTVFPLEKNYPAIIPVNETGEYSVAIFGSNGTEIDREPRITTRMNLSRTEVTEGSMHTHYL